MFGLDPAISGLVNITGVRSSVRSCGQILELADHNEIATEGLQTPSIPDLFPLHDISLPIHY